MLEEFNGILKCFFILEHLEILKIKNKKGWNFINFKSHLKPFMYPNFKMGL